MAEQPRVLIFVTTTYPYGIVETFIESEINFLAAAFDKIIIVTTYMANDSMRPIPANAIVLRKPYFASNMYKAKAVLSIFKQHIRQELGNIRSNLKLPYSKAVLSVLLGSLANGLSISDYIANLVKTHSLHNSKLFLYSYWLNDAAIGIALYKQLHPEVKAFCRAHRWDIYQNELWHKYAALRPFIFNNLDACYAISNGGSAYLNNITGDKYINKIQVARLGTFPHAEPVYSIAKPKFRLLGCSYMIPRKRINLVIEALSMLSHLHIEWVHLGGGPVLDEMRALAEQKISGNVSFDLKGLMTQAEIQAYYQHHQADLFINVSESEGVPVSIMEAYSYSIPAVATNTGGVADITNETNGFLVDVNISARQLADTIEYYYKLSEKDKEQYKQNAYATWNNLYNAQKNYTAFVDGVMKL